MSCSAPHKLTPVAHLKRFLRARVEAGFERKGECNLCGDCCLTMALCQGQTTINEPLDLPCNVCGEGYYVQEQPVRCPYLDDEAACSLYSPDAGLPFNCCVHFPHVKDILWHRDFYGVLPDCEFYLEKKKMAWPARLWHSFFLPFLWLNRLRHRWSGASEVVPALEATRQHPVGAPDPAHPVNHR